MSLLKVGEFKYINMDRVTSIVAKRSKVIIQFHNEVSCGGIGIPNSYLTLDGSEARDFLGWLESNSDKVL
jgi:hypothetical protein